MKRWMTRLDAACGWCNQGLVIIAAILALLDVAAAGQRWTLRHPQTSAKTIVADARSEQCVPAPSPELRDMAGRD